VVGGHGGRLDHLLANVALLAAEAYADAAVDAHLGVARLTVVRGRRALAGRPGELLTLLPFGGPARGVTTEGLLFPLAGATLVAGTTWGVSNQFATEAAVVTVEEGVLVAVAPGERGPL
jgi:thiamine pyrophosphokinase